MVTKKRSCRTTRRNGYEFVKGEWLLVIAVVGVLATSIYLGRLPSYSVEDAEVLYILFVLFVVMAGLQRQGVLSGIAAELERGRFIAMKMVIGTFFASMLVTNDVALVALVPVSLALHIDNVDWLIILEVLAANAGSSISPFGNPQNLFIYWFYQAPFWDFVGTIVAFSGVFFVLLFVGGLVLDRWNGRGELLLEKKQRGVPKSAYLYLGMLVLVILIVLRVFPLWVGLLVVAYAVLFDRGSLKVDYVLLATFGCFFGFTDNLQTLLSRALSHTHHVFLLSSLLSQAISNVPVALLLADFTPHWEALLWGVSVGGFGSLIASMANLIAYRIYVREERQRAVTFTVKFHIASYSAFVIGYLLYLLKFVIG